MSKIQELMPKIAELVNDRVGDFIDSDYTIKPSKTGWSINVSIGRRVKASIPYGTKAQSIQNDTTLVINSDISGQVIGLSEASDIVDNLSESIGDLYNIIDEFAYICDNLDIFLDEEDTDI